MKSLEECLLENLQNKRELITTIGLQMADDVKNEIISPLTVAQHSLALDNLDASAIHLEKGNYEESLYFFARGCSNMGEFKGRSDKERKKS